MSCPNRWVEKRFPGNLGLRTKTHRIAAHNLKTHRPGKRNAIPRNRFLDFDGAPSLNHVSREKSPALKHQVFLKRVPQEKGQLFHENGLNKLDAASSINHVFREQSPMLKPRFLLKRVPLFWTVRSSLITSSDALGFRISRCGSSDNTNVVYY